VIWNIGSGLSYLSIYKIDCVLNIGDASTATYLVSKDAVLAFNNAASIELKANAVFKIGDKISATETQYESYLIFETTGASAQDALLITSGNFYMYGGSIRLVPWDHSTQYKRRFKVAGGTNEVINTEISDWQIFWVTGGTNTLTNLMLHNLYEGVSFEGGTNTVSNLSEWSSKGNNLTFYINGADVTVYDLKTKSSTSYEIYIKVLNGADLYLDNCALYDITDQTWGTSFVGRYIFERYYIDINVCDKDGVAISGAVVDCEDQYGTASWTAGSITTDASGNITQQKIKYRRFAYSSGIVTTIYSPHKFTISKAGYQTLVLENITVSSPIKWRVELQPAGTANMSRVRVGH
jgi:hypothetical protein